MSRIIFSVVTCFALFACIGFAHAEHIQLPCRLNELFIENSSIQVGGLIASNFALDDESFGIEPETVLVADASTATAAAVSLWFDSPGVVASSEESRRTLFLTFSVTSTVSRVQSAIFAVDASATGPATAFSGAYIEDTTHSDSADNIEPLQIVAFASGVTTSQASEAITVPGDVRSMDVWFGADVASFLEGATAVLRTSTIRFGVDSSSPGDTDHDGDVDLVDLNNVRNTFGTMGDFVSGDANGDQLVDLRDLNDVRNHFGTILPASAVPEPASGFIVCIGILGMLILKLRGHPQ